MCGITGFYHMDANKKVDEKLLFNMTSALYHRGPDDEGYYTSDSIALGIRRLAIIDLKTGHQPIHNEKKTMWIVLNGEIYNYKELRKSLSANHTFYTNSDTETIIHLYEEKGIGCVHHLRGMFAFAIWDNEKKRLFIARDRIGQKPLIYAQKGNSFYFASEIKSLLKIPEISREMDYEALHHYFTYLNIPAPYTIYKSMRKLPAAHYMIIEKGKIKISEYWHCDYGKKVKKSEDEYIDEFYDIFKESVKLRLQSDAPLGIMLSGGVDSSAILATMRDIGVNNIKTFTIGYETAEKQDPEYRRARTISQLFNTEHHENLFEPVNFDLLYEVLPFYDEPINLFPTLYAHKISKYIKQYVTVVLNGNGADEILAGYRDYRDLLIRNMMYEVGSLFPFKINPGRSKIEKFLSIASMPASQRRAKEFEIGAGNMANNFYNERFKQEIEKTDIGYLMSKYFQKANSDNYLDGILNMDIMFYHISHTVMADISGMANSVEMRSPFLDHTLIEFVATLPNSMKVHSLCNPRLNKYILKKSMHNKLPHDILYGHKMGFGYSINWNDWLMNEWKPRVESMLFSGVLEKMDLFNCAYVRFMWNEFLSGKRKNAVFIWSLVVLIAWFEQSNSH